MINNHNGFTILHHDIFAAPCLWHALAIKHHVHVVLVQGNQQAVIGPGLDGRAGDRIDKPVAVAAVPKHDLVRAGDDARIEEVVARRVGKRQTR